jgi:hypothetical protein
MDWDFSLCQLDEIDSGTYTTSNLMGTRGSLAMIKADGM